MAYAFTVTKVSRGQGAERSVSGTFTSADGDTSGTLGTSVHGLNYISDWKISLAAGGVTTSTPKVSISSGEITFIFEDTGGYSGTFYVKGS